MFFLQDFLNMLRLYHISEEQASKVVLAKWKTQSKNEIVGISWSSVVEKMASNAHQHFFCLFLHDSKAFPLPHYMFSLFISSFKGLHIEFHSHTAAAGMCEKICSTKCLLHPSRGPPGFVLLPSTLQSSTTVIAAIKENKIYMYTIEGVVQ